MAGRQAKLTKIKMKIERLINAITEFEGWFTIGHPEYPLGSRSFRHHNPGNLRASPFSSGTKDGYAVFKNDELGRLALHFDILQKSKGNTGTGLNAKSTLRQLIFVYAPSADKNQPEKYLEFVTKVSGIPETTTLEELFR